MRRLSQWNEVSGYDALAHVILHLRDTAVTQGRTHSFDQLLHDLAERRKRKVHFLYGDYLGCSMDLIVFEEEINVGKVGPASTEEMSHYPTSTGVLTSLKPGNRVSSSAFRVNPGLHFVDE
jgi:aspartate aminotransferase-like enzyme